MVCTVHAFSYHKLLYPLQFPYCDGSHNAHNDTTGDNVGPLIVNKKE